MPNKYSDKQITEALKKSKGMVYVAAKQMGCSPNTILARMAKSPKLREVKEAEEQVLLDIAESRLGQKVYQGDLAAIKFLLATKGKSRGYVERGELKHTGEVKHTHVDERNRQYDALLSELNAYRTGLDDADRGTTEEQPLRTGSPDSSATQVP